jgi:predicted DNA-binding transcriptional regulator AlpA
MSLPSTSNNIQLSGFLRIKDVLKLIPVSKATWAEGVKRGQYPKAVHPSPGTSAWRTLDIETLIKQISDRQVK